LTASNATGQLVFLPALAWIVQTYGWRSGAVMVAVVAIAVVLPLVALLMRDRPADLGLLPCHSRTFWLLTGSFLICGASTNGLIGTHLIPAAMDHGIGEVPAASLLAAIGVFDIIGTTCSGWPTATTPACCSSGTTACAV